MNLPLLPFFLFCRTLHCIWQPTQTKSFSSHITGSLSWATYCVQSRGKKNKQKKTKNSNSVQRWLVFLFVQSSQQTALINLKTSIHPFHVSHLLLHVKLSSSSSSLFALSVVLEVLYNPIAPLWSLKPNIIYKMVTQNRSLLTCLPTASNDSREYLIFIRSKGHRRQTLFSDKQS